MVGEQQIRPQRCHLVGNKEYQTPPAMSYISPGSSSTATSHTACHIAPVPARITFPCLTLGSFINLPDVFVLLYRLCLAVTRDTHSDSLIKEGEEAGINKEDEAHPYGSGVEIVGETNDEAPDPKVKGKKRSKSSQKLKAIASLVEKKAKSKTSAH
ncbi:hypothetical protein M9H77_03409 [Catharanthus roseus]|uniref:Uncharacterized protein n=1 Tax=Catharanthus roseus TaxID=4058 RepID=A0ACC0CBM4_CATRO|nr:hypothetical protein M9H77_03409 [Catharanthus roseus]